MPVFGVFFGVKNRQIVETREQLIEVDARYWLVTFGYRVQTNTITLALIFAMKQYNITKFLKNC